MYHDRTVADIRGDLPDEQVEAALERGAELELELAVTELLGDEAA